jgi:hypothetical protein
MRRLGLVAALLLLVDCVTPAAAQVFVDQLTTPIGVLSVRPSRGSLCGANSECKVVELNGRVLLHDYLATIDFAYPNQDRPVLVGVTMSTGGNACCWESYLLDLTASTPLVVKQPGSRSNSVTYADGGVLFEAYNGQDARGDRLLTIFKYAWQSGRIVALKTGPEYSQTPISQKKYPEEVLSDPTVRAPIIAAVGPANFKEFRFDMAVQNGLAFVDSRYVVGEGCQPHNCCASNSIFVLDLTKRVAWAIRAEIPFCRAGTGTAKMWGNTLAPDDVVPSERLSHSSRGSASRGTEYLDNKSRCLLPAHLARWVARRRRPPVSFLKGCRYRGRS